MTWVKRAEPKPRATDIRAFIEARYAEREQAAKAAGGARWVWRTDSESEIIAPITAGGGLAVRMDAGNILMREHVIANDPRYVLDDLAAKRKLIDRYADQHYHAPALPDSTFAEFREEETGACRTCVTLRLLAAPFASHPDYDPAWRMEP